MGNYLNPDNSKFQRAVNSDIYVDKTESDPRTCKTVSGC